MCLENELESGDMDTMGMKNEVPPKNLSPLNSLWHLLSPHFTPSSSGLDLTEA